MRRIHPWDNQFYGFFALCMCTGLGMCIAGNWYSFLLVPGGVFIAGSLGMCASAFVRMYPWHLDNRPAEEAMRILNGEPEHDIENPEEIIRPTPPLPEIHIENQQINVIYQYQLQRQRSRTLPEIESESSSEIEIKRSQSEPLPRTLDLM